MSRTKEEIEENIKKVLVETVAPMLAMHAGGAELVSYDPESGVATVRFLYTCVGCPMSTMTLKGGVEAEILENVPEVQEVHAEGVDEESLEFIGEEE
ncbi:MAG: NifU family protein [Candidatus Magasanikbacteria bacterium]|nr:NifU family protein [Candidatus Magasanikbacteria bacterium]